MGAWALGSILHGFSSVHPQTRQTPSGFFGIGQSLLKRLRQHIIKEMFKILCSGVQSLAASRAARDDDTSPALTDCRWLIDKRGPIVGRHFRLHSGSDF
jgi:hypothetical protein